MSSPPNRAVIRLQLRELSQLFNSMDPSPFIDRDLDADAEEHILSWTRELPAASEVTLVIHLSHPPDPQLAASTQEAVHHYFNTRAELKRRELRALLRRGRTSLVIGLAFMAGCLFLGSLADESGRFGWIVRESLTIGGWVAMWRPLEIYLYDWWPVREEWRMLQRLCRMEVRLGQPAAPTATP